MYDPKFKKTHNGAQRTWNFDGGDLRKTPNRWYDGPKTNSTEKIIPSLRKDLNKLK